jgi:hypothetical protein
MLTLLAALPLCLIQETPPQQPPQPDEPEFVSQVPS